jgi:serine/threonine protein kinase
MASDTLPGTIGRYRILERLDKEGTPNEQLMGPVFLGEYVARDGVDKIQVVVKTFDPKHALREKWAEQFQREIDPHIMLYREFGSDGKLGPYNVLDYFDCKPISAASIASFKTEIIEKFAALAMALDKVHKMGQYHGLLKPSNILVRRPGKPDSAPIINDLGVRYVWDDAHFRGSKFVKSLIYLAPEVIGNLVPGSWPGKGKPPEPGPLSDIYSLAVVFNEVTTKKDGFYKFRDFRDNAVVNNVPRLMEKKTNVKELDLQFVAATRHGKHGLDIGKLNQYIERSLAPDPKERFQSMKEVADFLLSCKN